MVFVRWNAQILNVLGEIFKWPEHSHCDMVQAGGDLPVTRGTIVRLSGPRVRAAEERIPHGKGTGGAHKNFHLLDSGLLSRHHPPFCFLLKCPFGDLRDTTHSYFKGWGPRAQQDWEDLTTQWLS